MEKGLSSYIVSVTREEAQALKQHIEGTSLGYPNESFEVQVLGDRVIRPKYFESEEFLMARMVCKTDEGKNIVYDIVDELRDRKRYLDALKVLVLSKLA